MDKEYFLNAGNPPSLQPFNSSPIPNWQLHCSPEQSSDCFLNPNYESSLSSIVSSPATSNPAVSKDSFAIRELIKKLGTICNSGEILPESHPLLAAKAAYIGGGNNSSSNNYSTPFNSPPKLNFPIMDHQFVKENLPNLGNSVPLNPNLPALSTDPGFAERAARFSCFGSRSFNDRTTHLGLNNTELSHRSSPLMTSVKLPRVSSSPSLKSQENKNCRQTHMEMSSKNGSDTKLSTVSESNAWNRTEFGSSNEESSVSEQIPNRDSNSRKRKGFPRGKSKDSVNPPKVVEAEDDPNSKRSKSNEGNGSENGRVKTEKETKGTRNGAGDEAKTKPPEPPKDYIHVRARRGQATDSHSLAERVRREKISERMKLLQDLVPGCNKVTGKALMLDEIINYVQSLQRQVEFLSMKLASVNPRLDFDMDSLLSKDVFQPNVSLPHPTYPLDSSSSAFFGHQTPQVHTNLSKGAVNPIDTTLCPNIGFQLPQVDEFGQALPQFPTLCEDDLQSFVEMGFVQNPNRETGFHSENFPGSSQTSSHMKIEL